MKIFPNKLTAKQRTQVKLAKINRSVGKSAISEIGKTVRSVAGQISANRGYKTFAQKQIAEAQERRQSANEKSDTLAKALTLYNKVFEGNGETEGDSGVASTTQVGGAGSAIGG